MIFDLTQVSTSSLISPELSRQTSLPRALTWTYTTPSALIAGPG
jgi:hypothetical protein